MCMLNMFTYFGSDGRWSMASPVCRRINSGQICRPVSVFFSAASKWYIDEQDK